MNGKALQNMLALHKEDYYLVDLKYNFIDIKFIKIRPLIIFFSQTED